MSAGSRRFPLKMNFFFLPSRHPFLLDPPHNFSFPPPSPFLTCSCSRLHAFPSDVRRTKYFPFPMALFVKAMLRFTRRRSFDGIVSCAKSSPGTPRRSFIGGERSGPVDFPARRWNTRSAPATVSRMFSSQAEFPLPRLLISFPKRCFSAQITSACSIQVCPFFTDLNERGLFFPAELPGFAVFWSGLEPPQDNPRILRSPGASASR